MGRASERKLRKEARRLVQLVETDIGSFITAWNVRIDGWLREMRVVAARGGSEDSSISEDAATSRTRNSSEIETISGVCRRADKLIRACGASIETLVGTQTRDLLDAECARLIADVYEPRLYRVLAHAQYSLKGKPKNRIRVLPL